MTQIAEIMPSCPSGRVLSPPCKSMAHRLLICAGLAAGISSIRNAGESEDVLATIDCLKALGAKIEKKGNIFTVTGKDILSSPDLAILPCRECGSTLRFFIPLCLIGNKSRKLTGSETLMRRPLSVYEKLCKEKNFQFRKDECSLTVKGELKGGRYYIPGNISSQFLSGLLFALPLSDEDSKIEIDPPLESRPYVDLTLSALHAFGIEADWESENRLYVKGKQKYHPIDVSVEGDWSNAAFFLAMGVQVDGLDPQSLQGDRICKDHFARLKDREAKIDITDTPDLGPVLFVFAAMHHGGRFSGIKRLRDKESDRVAAMAEELKKCGVDCSIFENEIAIKKGFAPPQMILDGHNDHRVVMALSVLCAKTGGKIAGAGAVGKSFPDFFERMKEAGIKVKMYGMDQ